MRPGICIMHGEGGGVPPANPSTQGTPLISIFRLESEPIYNVFSHSHYKSKMSH